MKGTLFSLVLIIVSTLTLFSPVHGQFTHEFTQTAHNTHYGDATSLAVGSGGTVFMANRSGGLRVYRFNGTSFTNTAHIDDGGWAYGVALGSAGTVFLAIGEEGLVAYAYDPITALGDNVGPVPANYALLQNYPNPFNPETVIRYQLPVVSDVTLEIYNLLGKKIATLVNARQNAGQYRVAWDGRDAAGTPVAAGIYLYRLRAGNVLQTRKMILVK